MRTVSAASVAANEESIERLPVSVLEALGARLAVSVVAAGAPRA